MNGKSTLIFFLLFLPILSGCTGGDESNAVTFESSTDDCGVNVNAGDGNGYIISYNYSDGQYPYRNHYYPVSVMDWDLDGVPNFRDYYPFDMTMAYMPACGANFGKLSSSIDYNLQLGNLDSIDGMEIVDWDQDGDYDILLGGTSSISKYDGIIIGIENIDGHTFDNAVNLKNLGSDFRFFDPSLSGDVDDIALIDRGESGDEIFPPGEGYGLIVGTAGWTREYSTPDCVRFVFYNCSTQNDAWDELSYRYQSENPWADDLSNTQRARDIIVADIDGDGDHDWAINYRTTENYDDNREPIIKIHGDEFRRYVPELLGPGEVSYIIDWYPLNHHRNSDEEYWGELDLLRCKYSCQILKNNLDISEGDSYSRYFSSSNNHSWSWEGDGTAVSSSATADYDNDGDYDLAIGTEKNIYIFQMPESGVLSQEPTFSLNNQNSRYLHWADIDGNGILDLISGNDGKDNIFGGFLDYNTNDKIYEITISLVWSSESTSKTNFIMARDIDLDGDLDILGSDLNSVFIIMNEEDNNTSFMKAKNQLSQAYILIMFFLLLIPVSRSILLTIGRPEIFMKFGFIVFLLLQICIFFPLQTGNDSENYAAGTEWHDSVFDCGWNEECVANVWLSEHPILSIFSDEEKKYMELEQENYQPIYYEFMIGWYILSIFLIITLIKHYRKTNELRTFTPRSKYIDNTISSYSGFFFSLFILTFFSPQVDQSFFTINTIIGNLSIIIAGLLFLSSNPNFIPYKFGTRIGFLNSYVDKMVPITNISSVRNTQLRKITHTSRTYIGDSEFVPNDILEHLSKYKVPNLRKALVLIGISGISQLRKKQLISAVYYNLKKIELELVENPNPQFYLMYKKASDEVGMSTVNIASSSSVKQISIGRSDKEKNYSHISINSPIKDIQEVAEAEGRTVQEIYEDLMDDGIINKSNVEKGPVMTQQLNEEFEELVEITVSNAHTYEDWMELAANGQRMQEGAIADVWRIKSDQGNLFIKTAYDEKGKKVLLKEIATLEDLMEENLGSSHPHIFFQSKDEDKPLLVMTQVGERSLETDYDNIDTRQAIQFLYYLALDIQKLHNKGYYIHRDLKPGNIAINDTRSGNSIYAGLIDFGSARKNMRKQGDGDRFISEPWTHPSQRDIGIRVRPGQDWYSFAWISMCIIMRAKYDQIQAMIEGGSFQSKFQNKIANIDSINSQLVDLDALKELIELVTKFGEKPDLEVLEIVAEKLIPTNR